MGINIPDMIKIIQEHGLIPVPVDYDIDTMAPANFNDIKTLTTDKVRNSSSMIMMNLSSLDESCNVHISVRCPI